MFYVNKYLMNVTALNILSSQAVSSQPLQPPQPPQQQVEVSCDDDATGTGDNITFTVLSKKGNKQQVTLFIL